MSRAVRRFLDVEGWAGLPAYFVAVTVLYAAAPIYVDLAARLGGAQLRETGLPWLLPFRALAQASGTSPWIIVGGLLVTLASAAGIGVVSLRRLGSHAGTGWCAALAMVPFIQLVAVVLIAAIPLFEDVAASQKAPAADRVRGADVVHGVLAGVSVMVFAVAIATLGFGTYGFGLFVLTPLLVGFATGHLANRRAPISGAHTARGVFGASAIGSALLLIYGLEGGICMLMAIPITGLLAILGGSIGRELALVSRRRVRPTAMSLAVLPLAFAVEASVPSKVTFATSESVMIAAPPEAVWRAVVDMGEIGGRPALPFRLGLAHPLRAEIVGQGVGSSRVGVFSTGVARERVTAWQPNRRLAFEVFVNPPAMRELSPYGRVEAPHAEGYFSTSHTSFEITSLGDGRSRLTLRADHILALEPTFYWEPLSRWAIASNSRRVLAHVARRAEAVAKAPPLAQSEPSYTTRLDPPADPA